MTLTADAVRITRGGFALEVDLAVAPGERLAVVGPNGAGKTTLLDALAGLVAIDAGELRCGDAVWDAPARGAWTAPADRRIGLVPQQGRLLPHLTALDNVAFGPRSRGVGRREARRRAAAWLDRLGVGELADWRPASCSGGQAMRIALARALVTDPVALLLDEPMASLDLPARGQVRHLLATEPALAALPTVLVSHEPLEAMTVADRVLVLEAGRVIQAGTPAEVAAAPASAWAAELVGVNVWRGEQDGDEVALDGGGRVLVAAQARGRVSVRVHPRAVALYPDRPGGSPRNVWPVRVAGLHDTGGGVRVSLTGPPDLVAEVRPETVASLGLVPGGSLWASVKASEVATAPA